MVDTGSVERVRGLLRQGCVIPAHPLALDAARRLDERSQRALTRYYLAAGAGGVAVGVHTTQFAIREPGHGLLEPVLALASEEVARHESRTGTRAIRVAGICGDTRQAVSEAQLAQRLNYDVGLLSLSALRTASVPELIAHAREVSQVIPIMGFYLQPAVGGRVLPLAFWRRFAEIENVVAIKIAPFNRYQTLDVLRGVAESGRASEIALYTGNDDNILPDLLTRFEIPVGGRSVRLEIVGGLLGHWAVWTRRAVEHLKLAHEIRAGRRPLTPEVLTLAARITDANAALFDAANGFAGCIAGLHEILHRQGLMAAMHCLNPHEHSRLVSARRSIAFVRHIPIQLMTILWPPAGTNGWRERRARGVWPPLDKAHSARYYFVVWRNIGMADEGPRFSCSRVE